MSRIERLRLWLIVKLAGDIPVLMKRRQLLDILEAWDE